MIIKKAIRFVYSLINTNINICLTISHTCCFVHVYKNNHPGNLSEKLLCLPFERRETYCFSLIFFFRFFCFFSAKLVRTITFLSFQIGQSSRSYEGHYGTGHTALWACTHIPNIIDLSGKTKKLWSGQASLRRSGSGGRR